MTVCPAKGNFRRRAGLAYCGKLSLLQDFELRGRYRIGPPGRPLRRVRVSDPPFWIRLQVGWNGLFDPVPGLGFLSGLPLHVARVVCAATLQRNDVIDHVAGAGARWRSGRGQGWLAWNARRAAGLRWIRPLNRPRARLRGAQSGWRVRQAPAPTHYAFVFVEQPSNLRRRVGVAVTGTPVGCPHAVTSAPGGDVLPR
jgi:hypothetical protein